MTKRLLKEDFVNKSLLKQKKKKDYSKVEYVNNHMPVCIICHELDENGEEHGEFWQSPMKHQNGQEGCKKCQDKISWTFEMCLSEALKYKKRIDFYKNSSKAYDAAKSHKWLDKVCEHMKIWGNKYKRCIYVYEFKELNSAYIGLTYNINNRNKGHHTNGRVYNFSLKNNIEIPNPIQLTDYIDVEEAAKLEGEFLDKYKKEEWNIINKVKTGQIGGYSKYGDYNKEMFINKVKNFKSIYEIERKDVSIYNTVMKMKWEDEVFKCFYDKRKVVLINIEDNTHMIYKTINDLARENRINATIVQKYIKEEKIYKNRFKFIKFLKWEN